MSRRMTTTGDQADMLRLRKELIQSRSQIQDLQEDLEEKTHLYLEAIKMRDRHKEQLESSKQQIDRFDVIVQSKVTAALGDDRKRLQTLQTENDNLKEKLEIINDQKDKALKDREEFAKESREMEQQLQTFTRGVGNSELMTLLKKEKDLRAVETKRVQDLLHQVNSTTHAIDNLTAENKCLRKMAKVPENYGLDLSSIRVHEKDKVEDFKKLIKILQNDNYKLEEERARLKHYIKAQSMMYSAQDGHRYKDFKFNQEQYARLDQFAHSLMTGEGVDTSDIYALKQENQKLKHQLEVVGSQSIIPVLQKFFAENQALGGGNEQQFQMLLNDNRDLKNLLQNLSAGGGYQPGGTIDSINQQSVWNNDYLRPTARVEQDGSSNKGVSHKFNNSQLSVVSHTTGEPGVYPNQVNAGELAYYQVQLKEVIELNKKKDDDVTNKQNQINALNKKLRQYLLTQDQLYKDLIRVENSHKKKEEELKLRLSNTEGLLLVENRKVEKLQQTTRAFEQQDKASLNSKLLELTKQNSILEVNLLKLTRKYKCLEEQEKLLRREYHAKDEEDAEKDRYVQQRINSLKSWKARAIHQLSTLFEKLRSSVPKVEYSTMAQNYELAQQKFNDMTPKYNALIADRNKLKNREKEFLEAEERFKHLEDDKDEVEQELNTIRRRLEKFDKSFLWENQVFEKIAQVLKRANISIKATFEEFDENKDGEISKSEFLQALQKLRITDLNNMQIDALWNSVDTDQSGAIDYREFVRKLERYGVRNRAPHEDIIYQMIEAAHKARIGSMAEFFKIIDTEGKGLITHQSFKDVFISLQLNVDERALDSFLGTFWKTHQLGIDYKEFLRIFTRFEVRLSQDQKARKSGNQITSDAIIHKKKQLYERMHEEMQIQNVKIEQLFAFVDTDDGSAPGLDADDLWTMLQKMGFADRLTRQDSNEIFASIDFDNSGDISLPEFQADMDDYLARTENQIMLEMRAKQQQQAQEQRYEKYGQDHSMGQYAGHDKEVVQQMRIDSLKEREKGLLKKIETQGRILDNANKSTNDLRAENDLLVQKYQVLSDASYTLKADLTIARTKAANSCSNELFAKMQEDLTKLKTELTETRAAMLSYKNMYGVIGNQVKDMKLIHERKKDEQDNLFQALREMQAEDVGKERLGKLYYVIMMSRWQEAAVNKKYERAISEVKELRGQLLSSEMMLKNMEQQYHNTEENLREASTASQAAIAQYEHLRATAISQEEATKYQNDIQDLVESRDDLEEHYLQIKAKNKADKDALLRVQKDLQYATSMLQTLDQSSPSELHRDLIELSQKLSEANLVRAQAESENAEVIEQNRLAKRLMDKAQLERDKLQKQVASFDGELLKLKDEHRKQINKVKDQFFDDRFKENRAGEDFYQNYGRPGQQQDGGAAQRIAMATTLSTGHNNAGADNFGVQADMYKANKDFQNNPVHEQDYNQSFGRGRTMGLTQTGSNFNNSAYGGNAGERVAQLTEENRMLLLEITGKDAQINRLQQWQYGDKYLATDNVIKEEIDQHRDQTMQAANEDNKQMAEAAHQTVMTLQSMLDSKIDMIRKKEGVIADLKRQMQDQRQIDLEEIASLRKRLADTGETTLSKMHEIVAKANSEAPLRAQKERPNSKYDSMKGKEIETQLNHKDQMIKRLEAERSKFTVMLNDEKSKSRTLAQEKSRMEEKLLSTDQTQRIKSQDLQISKLKKDLAAKIQKQATLDKAIQELNMRMIKYESEKLEREQESEMLKNTDKAAKDLQRIAEQKYEGQIKIIKANHSKAQEESQSLKVQLHSLEQTEATRKKKEEEIDTKMRDMQRKLDQVLKEKETAIVQYEQLRRESQSTSVGAGSLTYPQLQAKVRDLENQVAVADARSDPCLKYNKDDQTFETIAKPCHLDVQKELTSFDAILERLTAWAAANRRISTSGIFKSLDRGNFNQLADKDFQDAFGRMGILLRPNEFRLVKSQLDSANSGYLRYEEIVGHIEGIPQWKFVNEAVKSLAKLVDGEGLTAESFQRKLDPTTSVRLDLTAFKTNLSKMGSSFPISDRQAEEVFRSIAGASGKPQVVVTEVVEKVFHAVEGLAIERMQTSLMRSEKSLIDILHQHASKKNGMMEYGEVENLMNALQIHFNTAIFQNVVIGRLLDKGKRVGRVSFEALKYYFGEGAVSQSAMGTRLDREPHRESGIGRGVNQVGKQETDGVQAKTYAQRREEEHSDTLKQAARKILVTFAQSLHQVLSQLDHIGEGLVDTTALKQVVADRSIADLKESDLDLLIGHCDTRKRGYVVISNFVAKLQDLAKETDEEARLKRFSKMVGHQGLNMRAKLNDFDQQKKGTLNLVQFKKAVKSLSFAMSDTEIEGLYKAADDALVPDMVNQSQLKLDVRKFCELIARVAKEKPVPSFVTNSVKPGSKVSKGGAGTQGAGTSAFEHWEMEKKYKRNLEALKQEIEERNREIKNARTEALNANNRAKSLEEQKDKWELELVNKKAKTAKEMRQESIKQGELDQMTILNDKLFHLQEQNHELKKALQVDLKARVSNQTLKNEALEEEIRRLREKLREKDHQLNSLLGRPGGPDKMDDVSRREEAIHSRQIRIEELEEDLKLTEEKNDEISELLEQEREKVLELRFEKESHDLQTARLQKRIEDLNNYKMQSSALSAELKQQHELEIQRIREESGKIDPASLTKSAGETNKLRGKPPKNAQEQEMLNQVLVRKIDKDQVEIDKLKKENAMLLSRCEKKSREPELLKRIETLEQELQQALINETNSDDFKKTIRTLSKQNKELGQTIVQERKEFQALQDKYTQLLVQFRSLEKESQKQSSTIFGYQTGAQFGNYKSSLDQIEDLGFLDDDDRGKTKKNQRQHKNAFDDY